MPRFRYTAANSAGGIRQGVLEAKGKAEAVAALQERGLMLMDLVLEKPTGLAVGAPAPAAEREPAARTTPATAPTRSAPVSSPTRSPSGSSGCPEPTVAPSKTRPAPTLRGLPTPERRAAESAPLARVGWSASERAVFFRQLALMFNSGISLFQALASIGGQTRRPAVRERLESMVRGLEQGHRLSSLMQRSTMFSSLQSGTVRIGEQSGRLGVLLESLAEMEERELALRGKLIARLSYPAAVLLAVTVSIALLGHIMGGVLTDLTGRYPTPKLAAILFTARVVAHPLTGIALVVVPLLGLTLLRWMLARPDGRRGLERTLLASPVGSLWRRLMAVHVCRLLALMVTSGIRPDQALEMIAESSPSPATAEALRDGRQALMHGESLSQALEQTGFFPREVTQMTAAGEESGRLSEMLSKVADYAELEVDRFIETLSAAIEPALMCILGVAVGCIMLATFAPIYQFLEVL